MRRLYEAHGRGLIAYASALLRERASAEDVVHSVFARLLQLGTTINGEPEPYLYRAVRNGVLDHVKRRGKDVTLESAEQWFEAPPTFDEMGLALQSAIVALPEEQREVLVLRVWGGLTFEQVAQTLGISPNTAASRHRYALGRLRELLKPLDLV